MKKSLLVAVALITIFLSACDPETGLLIISGQVIDGINTKVGLFGISPEVLYDLEYVDGTNPYTSYLDPIVIAVPDVNGYYTITFPDDIAQIAYLIAWEEDFDDDRFEVAGELYEEGRFPIKTIDTTDHVITGWGSIAGILTAQDDSGNLLNLDAIGTDGFNFQFYPG